MFGTKSNSVSKFLVLAAVIFSAFSIAAVAQPDGSAIGKATQSPQVRMRWQDFSNGPEGQKRLASLLKAITKMKSLDQSPKDSADYRRSWQYWANIHGYYGAGSPDGTVESAVKQLKDDLGMGQYESFYKSITNQSAPDATALAVWAQCQHSYTDDANKVIQAPNFFGWHRMYLYYFERVLRWAAEDDTLRLPYWDYTNPQQVKLPQEFRNPKNSGIPNPLYNELRDAGINKGRVTLDPNATNIDSLLGKPDFLDFELNVEYINHSVHGYVHCTVGPDCPVADMGDVPVAANDPVFYSHHANIDRLWACWQKLHPTPAGVWQNAQFSFVDETGAMQTKPIKEFLDSVPLGYVYDNVDECARQKSPLVEMVVPAQMKSTLLGKTERPIPIDKPKIMLDISVPPTKLHGFLAEGGKIDLVLRDITADSHPGVMFNVYVAHRATAVTRKYAGTISWFGAFSHHGKPSPIEKTVRFEVTNQLRELENRSGDQLTIIVQATQGRVPSEGGPTEEFLQVAADKAFRPEAKLKIGVIELLAVVAPKD